jgi:hypothetical protein
MNEPCDRCDTRAAYYVTRAAGRLFFCTSCAYAHWPVLAAGGWLFWPVDAAAIAPQGITELAS